MRASEIITWVAAAGAFAAWGVALVSGIRAIRETRKLPGGDAIARKAVFNWIGAAKQMPPAAQPYVRRLWLAIGVFMVCVITGILAGFVRTGLI